LCAQISLLEKVQNAVLAEIILKLNAWLKRSNSSMRSLKQQQENRNEKGSSIAAEAF